MLCAACGKECPIDFSFCPHCGKPANLMASTGDLTRVDPVLQPASPTQAEPAISGTGGAAASAIKAGTVVFAAFSAISLVVSLVKGMVPIFLIESAGWAGLAWFWQSKKTHNQLARSTVAVLAAVVAVGEVAHVVMQWSRSVEYVPAASSVPVYPTSEPNVTPHTKGVGPSTTRPPADAVLPNGRLATSANAKPEQTRNPKRMVSKPSAETIRRRALDLYTDSKYREAAPLLDQSCTNGYAYTCEVLGYMYEIDLGVSGDSSRAQALYERTVDLYLDHCVAGSADGCSQLEDLYLYENQYQIGNPHIDRKYLPREIVIFTKACNTGTPEACRYLGDLYWKGKDVVQDHTRAVALYTSACGANNADACGELGNAYRTGTGVTKDDGRAREYSSKGCNLGFQWACDKASDSK